MKQLAECKEYFKGLYKNVKYSKMRKDEYEEEYTIRFNFFCEAMRFIYGDDFDMIRPHWTREAITEFYKGEY